MKYLFFFFFVLAGFIADSQTNIVTGIVFDQDSKLPMANCNVFISNSSIGVISNAAGKFALYNIPNGNSYEIIVSAAGYETYTSTFSWKQLPLSLNVKLNKKIVSLENVVIMPVDPMGWDKWGEQFVKYFIGESENSASCRIENPEALKFRYNKAKDYLEVSADTMLVIKNRRLGYVIKYQLEKFYFDESNQIVKYLGYPLFEELEPDSNYRTQYIKRRQKAYYGSITHFMRCVYNNRLLAEGFRVQKLDPEPGFGTLGNDGRVIKIDIGGSDDKKNKQPLKKEKPKQKLTIEEKYLNRNDLLFKGDDSVRNILSFDNYLYIKYTVEPEAIEYNMFPEYSQVSKIYILNDTKKLAIQPNGKYYPPLDLLIEGYMGWEKIGDLMPVDYQPPLKKDKEKKVKMNNNILVIPGL